MSILQDTIHSRAGHTFSLRTGCSGHFHYQGQLLLFFSAVVRRWMQLLSDLQPCLRVQVPGGFAVPANFLAVRFLLL